LDSEGEVLYGQGFDPDEFRKNHSEFVGNPYLDAGDEKPNWGFTGEQTDENGMIFLRARYYQPGQGRFLTMDPWRGNLNRPNTLNPYLYASGNPVVFSDPSGKCPQPPSGSGNVICVDLFIQTETILFDFGYGDNRGFETNSGIEASRAFMHIHLDDDGRILDAPTTINPSCTIIGCFGPFVQYNTFTAEQNNGDIHVRWDLLNGVNAMLREHAEEAYKREACIGVMPHYSNFVLLMGISVDSIKGEMKISKMANGTYEIIYLNRDPYPSLEVYFYDDGVIQYDLGTFPEKFGPIFGPLLGLRGIWKETIGLP
jgi:RHS repeat-associated protein